MSFKFDNLPDALSYLRVLNKPIRYPDLSKIRLRQGTKERHRELIAGGDPVRDPVDKTTAMVVSPAPWWAQPIKDKKQEKIESKQTEIKMNHTIKIDELNVGNQPIGNHSPPRLKSYKIDGETMFKVEDVQEIIMEEINKLPKQTSPIVKQAQESREIIDQLLHGIGGEMERFKAESKEHINDIRSTRYAVVSEVNTMINSLKDVRQFFMGSDHKEQIERLRSFVELCERLQKLKESGFIDAVADTILKLDRP